jgi:hypothetical protein
MATQSATTSQRDFSAGEVDVEVKRDDTNPLMKAGARQMRNWRILNSKGVSNRPGRRAIFLEDGRVEQVTMAPGVVFFLAFGLETLRVYDANGALVFSEVGRPWNFSSVRFIRWAVINLSIYITYLSNRPRVLTWDGVATWSAADYAETVTLGNQKRTFFYRLSPLGVTMKPSTSTPGAGATLTFSAGMNLTGAFIGTRMRYIGRQVMITAVASAVSATATIEETLPASQVLGFSIDPTPIYSIGDKVQGVTTNSIAIVTQINSGAKQITVQLLSLATTTVAGRAGPNVFAFVSPEVVVGPGGALPLVGVTALGPPEPVTIWDDEIMNVMRGWPSSVFSDQNRLGFTNFPSVPRGIGWSAIDLPTDLYPEAQPSSAIFELAPQKCQVFDVVAGPESSEFVFTDKGIWYIAISATNPLKPGSVGFQRVSGDVCANVQPRIAQELIIYLTASLEQVMAISPVGATNRPYTTRDLTDNRQHLFFDPIAIAATSDGRGDIYVLQGNGGLVVGKLPLVDGRVNSEGIVGWVPWNNGSANVSWASALGSSVLFTTRYLNEISVFVAVVEQQDPSFYLDAALMVNAIPTALTPPVGKGPLWWLPGGEVDLMDQVTRMMGTYQIDNNGFIVPQGAGGEDLTAASLVAGIAWIAVLEPFIPPVQAGQDISQRMDPRLIEKAQVYVKDSTGFATATLYSGQSGPNLPAQGTTMVTRRWPAWNQGEDATQPPPLREQVYSDVPQGRSHDPRWVVIKDTPGPIEILEIATRTTV